MNGLKGILNTSMKVNLGKAYSRPDDAGMPDTEILEEMK